jgi:hypothetical protein
MLGSYVAVGSIKYTNYPFNNPEYAGGDLGEDYEGPPRFPSVYEFLDENWKIEIEYKVYETDIEGGIGLLVSNAETKVLNVAVSQRDYRSVTINIDTSKKFSVVTIQGTYSEIFDRKRFDFRMNNESLLENADTVKIGDDYYAPYNYIPDFRIWLENTFTINGTWEVFGPIPGKGTFSDSYSQTVLNNWDANRRRLLQFRDNPKRGEELERLQFGSTGNSADESFNDPDVPAPITQLR